MGKLSMVGELLQPWHGLGGNWNSPVMLAYLIYE